jgi:hypothetical protein
MTRAFFKRKVIGTPPRIQPHSKLIFLSDFVLSETADGQIAGVALQ